MNNEQSQLSIVGELGKEVLSALEQQLNKILQTAGVWLKEGLDSFLGGSENVKVVSYKEEFLKQDRLVEIARTHIVPNSNQIVAVMKKAENSTIIYLAYCKDKELLPECDNIYIVIEAEGINREIENLFGNEELIILN